MRDMDLVREILLEAERITGPHSGIPTVELEDRDPAAVRWHVRMLEKAGFLIAALDNSDDAAVVGLTWEGYDFLDSIREPSVWSTVRKKLAEVGGGASLEVVKMLATSVVKSRLGLPE